VEANGLETATPGVIARYGFDRHIRPPPYRLARQFHAERNACNRLRAAGGPTGYGVRVWSPLWAFRQYRWLTLVQVPLAFRVREIPRDPAVGEADQAFRVRAEFALNGHGFRSVTDGDD
jgi:hypothetical protein